MIVFVDLYVRGEIAKQGQCRPFSFQCIVTRTRRDAHGGRKPLFWVLHANEQNFWNSKKRKNSVIYLEGRTTRHAMPIYDIKLARIGHRFWPLCKKNFLIRASRWQKKYAREFCPKIEKGRTVRWKQAGFYCFCTRLLCPACLWKTGFLTKQVPKGLIWTRAKANLKIGAAIADAIVKVSRRRSVEQTRPHWSLRFSTVYHFGIAEWR